MNIQDKSRETYIMEGSYGPSDKAQTDMEWETKLQQYLENRDSDELTVNDYIDADTTWLSESDFKDSKVKITEIRYRNNKELTYELPDGEILIIGENDSYEDERLLLNLRCSQKPENSHTGYGIYLRSSGGQLLWSITKEPPDESSYPEEKLLVITNHTYDTMIPADSVSWVIESDFGEGSNKVMTNNIRPEYTLNARIMSFKSRDIVATVVCTISYVDGRYELTKIDDADILNNDEYVTLGNNAVEKAVEFITDQNIGPSFMTCADYADVMKMSANVEFVDSVYFGYCAGPYGEFIRAGELAGTGRFLAVSVVHPTVGNITVYLMTEKQMKGIRTEMDNSSVLSPIGYDFLLPETKGTIHVPGPAADDYERYRNSTGNY